MVRRAFECKWSCHSAFHSWFASMGGKARLKTAKLHLKHEGLSSEKLVVWSECGLREGRRGLLHFPSLVLHLVLMLEYPAVSFCRLKPNTSQELNHCNPLRYLDHQLGRLLVSACNLHKIRRPEWWERVMRKKTRAPECLKHLLK